MVPVNIVAVGSALTVLMLYFGRSIPTQYDTSKLRLPKEAIRDRATFLMGLIVLALLLIGFFWLEPLGVPISVIAATGSVLLLAVAARGRGSHQLC